MATTPELWQALIACRDRAERVARARGARRDDVDDIVQEAISRIARMPHVDLDRVGTLVTVVVARLVADRYRAVATATRHAPRLVDLDAAGADEALLDQAEAAWLWSRRDILGDQDRLVDCRH